MLNNMTSYCESFQSGHAKMRSLFEFLDAQSEFFRIINAMLSALIELSGPVTGSPSRIMESSSTPYAARRRKKASLGQRVSYGFRVCAKVICGQIVLHFCASPANHWLKSVSTQAFLECGDPAKSITFALSYTPPLRYEHACSFPPSTTRSARRVRRPCARLPGKRQAPPVSRPLRTSAPFSRSAVFRPGQCEAV